MKAEYRRDLQKNYLILEAAGDEAESGYGLRMAEQNSIRGLLPMHSARKDGKLYYHYEITSRQPLQSVYDKRKIGSRDMMLLFSSLHHILEEMRRYLLSPQALVFDPEMIYLDPDHGGVQLCYFPGGEESVAGLAEFLLKKLDHEDPQAVALGYRFYQQATGDNFSLTDTLQEILADMQEEQSRGQRPAEESGRAGRGERGAEEAGRDRLRSQEPAEERPIRERPERAGGNAARAEEKEAEEEYHVVHHERKKKPPKKTEPEKKKKELAKRLCSIIHPGVLASSLACIVVLEVLFARNVLDITEAGGCFFLLLSVSMLANRFLLNRGKKENAWQDGEEEADEEYGRLLEEMYASYKEDEPEAVGETCCLIRQPGDGGLRLVYQGGNEGAQNPLVIEIGKTPSYVGKIRGDSDVVLDCGTVSRTHAKLVQKGGACMVQDLNSKNGTFLNGKRLMPQEECALREGDVLVFAEVEYRAARKGVWREGSKASFSGAEESKNPAR